MDPLNEIDHELLQNLTQRYGLPLHVIFAGRVGRNLSAFRDVASRLYPDTLICFAVKANPCRGAVRLASRLGLGADVVSEYELQAALEEGIAPQCIVCNGNAKSGRYLEMAVDGGAIVAVDSRWELELLSELASGRSVRVSVLLRFAGMPLEGLTAADQSTASPWTKFGFAVADAAEVINFACDMPGIDLAGISAHIGTQVCDPTGFERLFENLLTVAELVFERCGSIRFINIGGGFPVSYLSREEWRGFQRRLLDQLSGKLPPGEWVTWDNLPLGYADWRASGVGEGGGILEEPAWRGKGYWSPYPGAAMFERLLSGQVKNGMTAAQKLAGLGHPTLIVEPGRALFGTAGITIAGVAGVKEVMGSPLVVVELGIVNHGSNLITPDIFPVEVLPRRDGDRPVEAFLAGRLCFTGDMISKVKVGLNRLPERGDLLVIHHTGAYSADHFASNSCGFPKPAKVAVMEDGSVELWRRADAFEEVFAQPSRG